MLKNQSTLPPTPERRPPLANVSTVKPTPAKLRSHRKLPDTPSSSNLVEQCLNDLDEIVKNGSPTSSEILSLLINKHNSDEIAAERGSQEVNLEREIVVPPISSSKVIMKCVSDLDDMIARRKKELSDIHRSGGQRSTQRKKMRKIEGDTADVSTAYAYLVNLRILLTVGILGFCEAIADLRKHCPPARCSRSSASQPTSSSSFAPLTFT